jgi:hypothetical protein
LERLTNNLLEGKYLDQLLEKENFLHRVGNEQLSGRPHRTQKNPLNTTFDSLTQICSSLAKRKEEREKERSAAHFFEARDKQIH